MRAGIKIKDDVAYLVVQYDGNTEMEKMDQELAAEIFERAADTGKSPQEVFMEMTRIGDLQLTADKLREQ